MTEKRTKICAKCHKELDVNEFHKCKRNRDGLYNYCKDCKSVDDRKYREKNKEAKSQRDKIIVKSIRIK